MLRNNRNYEKYAEPVPLSSIRHIKNPNLTIAGILSPNTLNELSYECAIIDLTNENNIDIFKNNTVDFLLVEEIDFSNTNINYILEICKQRGTRCVFWDTKGNDFFYQNIDLIKQFDYIFTIKQVSIDEYKNLIHNENIFFMPLGVQPRIYNPIEKNLMNKLDFISEKSSLELSRVIGSNKLYSVIFKNLDDGELPYIPKEIFKLLATGTALTSEHYKAINEFFPEILDNISNDRDYLDKLATLSLRNVFSNHTYTNRLEEILLKIGLSEKVLKIPGVSVVTATNRLDSMENVFNNYENQSYPNKELIIVLNNNKMDIDEWKSKALEYNNVKVFQMDEKEPLGRCLNLAIDNSDYPYLSKCDDDNYYAPYFLSDLMNAFCYTDAQIVGKLNYYCYLEGLKTLAMICPNMEHRYVNMLSGSALIINRNVFLQVRFSDKPTGCDSVFLKDCLNKGVLMYSTDRFNYVYKRHKSQANHTFKMQDEVFLKSCRVVDITDDFIKMVTV